MLLLGVSLGLGVLTDAAAGPGRRVGDAGGRGGWRCRSASCCGCTTGWRHWAAGSSERLSRDGEPSRIAEAFITASLVFCVGPLTLLGSIKNGLTGDTRLLAVKSMLDGLASIAFAAALGWGVALAAITVFAVQGAIAAAAFLLRDTLDERTILVVSSVGGILLIGVALRLLEARQVRVANFLPALVLAPLFLRVFDAIRGAIGG